MADSPYPRLQLFWRHSTFVKAGQSQNWSAQMRQVWTKTGNRLFIPVNPFRKSYEGFKKTGRKHDIFIANGYQDSDSIVIVIPEGHEPESIPGSFKTETAFGHFVSSVDVKGNEIIVKQTLLMKNGHWKVSAYPEFVAFIEKIASNYKSKSNSEKENK